MFRVYMDIGILALIILVSLAVGFGLGRWKR